MSVSVTEYHIDRGHTSWQQKRSVVVMKIEGVDRV